MKYNLDEGLKKRHKKKWYSFIYYSKDVNKFKTFTF